MPDLFPGKLLFREIGNDVLINPFFYLKTNHVQPHAVFGTAVRDKVKGDSLADTAV